MTDSPDPARAELSPGQEGLLSRFRAGELRALSRAISLVENQAPGFETLLQALREGVGHARRIGITGPPGAGKSTLTAALARRYRDAGDTVGVIAVDPTSPFTGGALLGDRVRMDDLATEPGIFIRSMASRGSFGGLATTTREAADLMDAFGFDRILLETVGVGQSELEVATSADTTVVVLVPESGDGIQAMKAGLMEVADLFVVNKADRPGADRLKREIEVVQALRTGRTLRGVPAHHGVDLSAMRRAVRAEGETGEGEAASTASAAVVEPDAAASGSAGSEDWTAPVLMCVASTGEGVDELREEIARHEARLRATGALVSRRAIATLEHARRVLARSVQRRADAAFRVHAVPGETDAPGDPGSPYEIARRIAARLLRSAEEDG